jgi:pimeloyl-ACP methyl ester carboxylesterase
MNEQSARRVDVGAADHTISALNAWIGDFLARSNNGLQQKMAFYRGNRPLEPSEVPLHRESRLCILLHGLGGNEAQWRFLLDGQQTDYAQQLQSQHGFMPLYLRYNTGLRISENGALFASLLERLCARSDGPPRQIVLIGHSMGGLVIRSACHQGSELQFGWVSKLSHAIYLGSPHLGAPLEKAANIASNVLGLFDTTATRVIRDVLHSRSEGIKDMRYGNLVEEDWLEYDSDELLQDRRVPVPWLEGVRHCRIAGTIASDADHPVSRIFGDAMVRRQSADGTDPAGRQPGLRSGSGHLRVISGISHLELARNAEVSKQVESWISKA